MQLAPGAVPVWCERTDGPNRFEHPEFSAVLLSNNGALAAREEGGVIVLEVSDLSSSRSVCHFNPFMTVVPQHEVTGFEATVEWNDQGWGNRKGRLSIRGLVDTIFKPMAPHRKEVYQSTVQLSEHIPKCRPLDFCYTVGGGGGHSLHIYKLVVRVFTTQCVDEYLSAFRRLKWYLALANHGANQPTTNGGRHHPGQSLPVPDSTADGPVPGMFANLAHSVASALPDVLLRRVAQFMTKSAMRPGILSGVDEMQLGTSWHPVFGRVTPFFKDGGPVRSAVGRRFNLWLASADEVCVQVLLLLEDFRGAEVTCFTIEFERPVESIECSGVFTNEKKCVGIRHVPFRCVSAAGKSQDSVSLVVRPLPTFEIFFTGRTSPTTFSPEVSFRLQPN